MRSTRSRKRSKKLQKLTTKIRLKITKELKLDQNSQVASNRGLKRSNRQKLWRHQLVKKSKKLQ